MRTDNAVGITLGEVKGLIADLFEKLASETGQEWLAALKRFLKKQNPWPIDAEATAELVGTLREMIAAGRYDWINSDINEENFAPEALVLGEGAKLFHFDRDISSENAIIEMDKAGFKPGTLGDLLVFGAQNPEEQRRFPIVALGSVAVVHSECLVAYLDRHNPGRGLSLHWLSHGWRHYYRFLAVRK